MNDPAVTELIEVINDEIRLFGEMLSLLQEEQRALVANDTALIESNAMAQREMAAEAHVLEARRAQIVPLVAQRLGEDSEDVSLARLVALLSSEEGDELGRMRNTLLELMDRIRHVTASNSFLIRQSMRYTERCLDILTGQVPEEGMYGQFGRVRRGRSGRSLLNRTA